MFSGERIRTRDLDFMGFAPYRWDHKNTAHGKPSDFFFNFYLILNKKNVENF